MQKYLDEGKLPHFAQLAQKGVFSRLKTTIPAVSPVAWSSFQTGINPAKHNIFDFLDRDLKSYSPILSSAYIGASRKFWKIGKLRFPRGKPVMRLLRKSVPFWKILGDKGVFSNVLRVPITFPPEKFFGLSLSGMCTPDLKGSQGAFTCFTTAPVNGETTGGLRIPVKWNNLSISTYIPGPINFLSEKSEAIQIPLRIVKKRDAVQLNLNNTIFNLKEGEYSDWIKLTFKIGWGIKASGICRFYLTQLDPELVLYMSPINIDPEKPSLPVSYPLFYSVYLAKIQGLFSTLGLAEDTWALNEGVLNDEAFLKQVWSNHEERLKMFFHSLKITRKGLVVCVFDTSDRIQHMFWRYLEKDHPANKVEETTLKINPIEDMYLKMDELVGKTLEVIGDDEVLLVISDHGFKSFRRCFSANAWLKENGYLFLKEGAEAGDFFQGVDWNRTKAYAVGLGGIFINLKGREKNGMVERGAEFENLKQELKQKLTGLVDPDLKVIAIKKIYDIAETGVGPYSKNGPDLLFGFNPSYRISWDSATGNTKGSVFSDNVKKWSGDHALDPQQVPGIFFANRKIIFNDPDLRDISATCLDLFGVPIPSYMEGRPLMPKK
jgi:predicted AlkP superfamily phosphohydrolase/phosphomutase